MSSQSRAIKYARTNYDTAWTGPSPGMNSRGGQKPEGGATF